MPAAAPAKLKAHKLKGPYKAKPGPNGPRAVQNAPKSSKQPAKQTDCQNLTLNDWLYNVFPYCDAHPSNTQQQTVNYFAV
jgi:hypothetical protein